MDYEEIWFFENELQQFIDKANRCEFEKIYNGRTVSNPHSILSCYVKSFQKNHTDF